MTTYRTRMSNEVLAELQAIFDYIAKDSETNAANMISKILDGIDSLKLTPHRNIVVSKKLGTRFEVRTLPVWPYVIYFDINEADKVVEINHVVHGARQSPDT
jgi:plasmid stabilization system protein ParE